MRKILTANILFFFLISFPLWGRISFSGLDISEDNRLLFRSGFSGAPAQETLFVSRISDRSLKQLTAFPEHLDLIDNNRMLQIRNAFGVSRISLNGGLPQEVPGFPSFTRGSGIYGSGIRAEETAVSADGRWILLIEPETPAYGALVLMDLRSGSRIMVSRRVERPEKVFPASFSPDSKVFVYASQGKLYYSALNSLSTQMDEKYRLIGEGAINSIVWADGGDFFYLKGSAVFRVRGSELFTRALYADFLEIGRMAGKIPFEFNPNFDSFWIAPDGTSLLLSQGGRNIFYYPLENDDYNVLRSGGQRSNLPYLVLPRSCFNIRALWSLSGGVTVIASAPNQNGTALAWRLSPDKTVFYSMPPLPAADASLSPNGKLALLWGEAGIMVYDYALWEPLGTISSSRAYSCLWLGDDEIVIGDEAYIERIRFSPGNDGKTMRRDLICLSRASRFGFEEGSRQGAESRILAQVGRSWYVTDGRNAWTEIGNPVPRSASQVSSQYRVYLEDQNTGPYANLPMIRNTGSVGTFPLFAVQDYGKSYPSVKSDTSEIPGIFNHGLRSGSRELSLCFDLYDDIEGLAEALDALNRYGIKASFFLGGDFIRRYPEAARDIALSGHEAASLFFAPIDLSDPRFRIEADFISRGLARNEDEYFRATGKELALLWHTPWYVASPEAWAAASRAGYVTVGRDVDPLDWISREDEKKLGIPQYSAADMIDRILGSAGPGSIIPVRLGVLPGGRSDYLFFRLSVLLDALLGEGYSIVPVSQLFSRVK